MKDLTGLLNFFRLFQPWFFCPVGLQKHGPGFCRV